MYNDVEDMRKVKKKVADKVPGYTDLTVIHGDRLIHDLICDGGHSMESTDMKKIREEVIEKFIKDLSGIMNDASSGLCNEDKIICTDFVETCSDIIRHTINGVTQELKRA